MKKLALFLLALAAPAMAEVVVGPDSDFDDSRYGDYNALGVNSAGQIGISLLAGEDQTLDRIAVHDGGAPINLTATGVVKASGGVLVGIFVSASTSCTIKLWDNASAASGTVVLGTTAAITAPAFYPVKAEFGSGLYFTAGGTCDVTFYVI